jgi:hypothetical protein
MAVILSPQARATKRKCEFRSAVRLLSMALATDLCAFDLASDVSLLILIKHGIDDNYSVHGAR